MHSRSSWIWKSRCECLVQDAVFFTDIVAIAAVINIAFLRVAIPRLRLISFFTVSAEPLPFLTHISALRWCLALVHNFGGVFVEL